jgi:hypothetical protein
VLVDLSLADVVLGAVAVVAEDAAVCAETWMANRMVMARSTKRRDIVRKAMTALEVQYEVNAEVYWTLRTTKRESTGKIVEIDLQVLESRRGFFQSGSGFAANIIADRSFPCQLQ